MFFQLVKDNFLKDKVWFLSFFFWKVTFVSFQNKKFKQFWICMNRETSPSTSFEPVQSEDIRRQMGWAGGLRCHRWLTVCLHLHIITHILKISSLFQLRSIKWIKKCAHSSTVCFQLSLWGDSLSSGGLSLNFCSSLTFNMFYKRIESRQSAAFCPTPPTPTSINRQSGRKHTAAEGYGKAIKEVFCGWTRAERH